MEDNIQLKQLKKVFLAPFVFIISSFLIFISYKLIQLEYKEYFVYGNIKNGIISNIFWDNSSSESPSSKEFHCMIIVDKKNFDYTIQNANQSFGITDEEKSLIENISINDSIKVKILNEKEVKILEWKKKTINKKNNYCNIFWLWLLIFTLILISIILLNIIYKIYKQ